MHDPQETTEELLSGPQMAARLRDAAAEIERCGPFDGTFKLEIERFPIRSGGLSGKPTVVGYNTRVSFRGQGSGARRDDRAASSPVTPADAFYFAESFAKELVATANAGDDSALVRVIDRRPKVPLLVLEFLAETKWALAKEVVDRVQEELPVLLAVTCQFTDGGSGTK